MPDTKERKKRRRAEAGDVGRAKDTARKKRQRANAARKKRQRTKAGNEGPANEAARVKRRREAGNERRAKEAARSKARRAKKKKIDAEYKLRTRLNRNLENRRRQLEFYNDRTLEDLDSEFINAAPLEELERRLHDATERLDCAKWPLQHKELRILMSRIIKRRRSQLRIRVYDDRTLDDLDSDSMNATPLEELERRLHEATERFHSHRHNPLTVQWAFLTWKEANYWYNIDHPFNTRNIVEKSILTQHGPSPLHE